MDQEGRTLTVMNPKKKQKKPRCHEERILPRRCRWLWMKSVSTFDVHNATARTEIDAQSNVLICPHNEHECALPLSGF